MVNKIISTVINAIWSVNRVVTVIAGYIILVLLDPIEGIIVYPKIWAGIENETFEFLYWTFSTQQALAAAVGFALFALQSALISNIVKNIIDKKPIFTSGVDVFRLVIVLVLSVFDVFHDSLLGFIVTNEWTEFYAGSYNTLSLIAWISVSLFGTLSAFGEFGAEYIRLSYLVEKT